MLQEVSLFKNLTTAQLQLENVLFAICGTKREAKRILSSLK